MRKKAFNFVVLTFIVQSTLLRLHEFCDFCRPSSVLPSYTQALAQTRASSPTTKLVQHPQQGQIARSVPATNEAAKAILNDSPGKKNIKIIFVQLWNLLRYNLYPKFY